MRTRDTFHPPHVRAGGRIALVALALALWISFRTLASADATDDPGRVAERANLIAQTTFPAQLEEMPSTEPKSSDEQADALLVRAREIAAGYLGVPANRSDEVLLAAWEDVTWPDASLGCPREGMVYAAVMTPGSRLTFSYQSRQVIVHMEAMGRYGIVPKDCLYSDKYGPDAIPGTEYREPQRSEEAKTRGNSSWSLSAYRPINPLAQAILPGNGFLRVRVSWEPPFPSGVISVRPGEEDGERRYHEPFADIIGYTIARNDGLTFEVDAPITTVTDMNVQPGGQYTYTVIARSNTENSLPSDFTTIRIPYTPAAPRGLSADVVISPSGERATVTLNWQRSAIPRYNACVVAFPVSKYRLEQIDGGDAVLPLGEWGPEATSFIDTEVRRNTTYTYRLVAVNAVGDSPTATLEVSVP